MEQFNPSLRNFISMGKTYEKALASKCSGNTDVFIAKMPGAAGLVRVRLDSVASGGRKAGKQCGMCLVPGGMKLGRCFWGLDVVRVCKVHMCCRATERI